MLQPKRTKFRKAFKGRIHGNAKSGTTLAYGEVGLKAMEPERLTARQIEAARRAIARHTKRAGRMWLRIFPDIPVSKKPAEVRMGAAEQRSQARVRTAFLGSEVQVQRDRIEAGKKAPREIGNGELEDDRSDELGEAGRHIDVA